MITACVLFYGDYPELVERNLNSLLVSAPWKHVTQVRIGLNEVSENSKTVLRDFFVLLNQHVPVVVYECNQPGLGRKYPLMRRMFYDPLPIQTPLVLWMDDDSYLTEPANKTLGEMAAHLSPTTPQAGFLMRVALKQTQHLWAMQQPWCTKPVYENQVVYFAVGGFWLADFAFLVKFDYPFLDIKSQGGDYMLGLLIDQQGATVANYRAGYAVNASFQGQNHLMPRRGKSETPVGVFDPELGFVRDLRHQKISVSTTLLPVIKTT